MTILRILLGTAATGFFRWLLFTPAIFAPPSSLACPRRPQPLFAPTGDRHPMAPVQQPAGGGEPDTGRFANNVAFKQQLPRLSFSLGSVPVSIENVALGPFIAMTDDRADLHRTAV